MANKFLQSLEDVGKVFLKILADCDKAAVIAEPFVDVAFPALAPIYNAAANGAAAGLTAGKSAYNPAGTDEENVVAIALAVEPVVVQYAQTSGLPAPTTAQILKYAQALAASLKAI